jgi:hypothetical protein
MVGRSSGSCVKYANYHGGERKRWSVTCQLKLLAIKENAKTGTPNQAPLGLQQKHLQSTAFGGVVLGFDGVN